MWVEQAIFTSLSRHGKAGYHLVSRSPGVSDEDARVLTVWSPSHGALMAHDANRASVNFHPLGAGRHALSRTVEGTAEYSGRGGRQLYTHILIVERAHLQRSSFQPIALYRDALAQGHLRFRPDPGPTLEPVPLSEFYLPPEPPTPADAEDGRDLKSLRHDLDAGRSLKLRCPGDRVAFIERLLAQLPPESRPEVSFTTGLKSSLVRPFRLTFSEAETGR